MFLCMKDGIINTTGEKSKACENCKFYICKVLNKEVEMQKKLSDTMRDSMHAIAGYYEE